MGEPTRIQQFEDIEAISWPESSLATRKVNERKRTLPPAQRAYGPEGTVKPEPVNAYDMESGTPFSFSVSLDNRGWRKELHGLTMDTLR